GASCDLMDITRDVVEQPHQIEAVTYQRTGLQVLPECRDRRNAALKQGLRDGLTVTEEHRACRQNDRLAAGVVHCAKCATVVLLTFHLDHARLKPQLAGRLGRHIALLARNPVEGDSEHSGARERLASDLDPFGGELELAYENA